MAYTKNTAVTGFAFGPLVNKNTGAAITSGVTGYVTLDGGTQAALAGTPVHEGNGQWSIDLTAAEMNGNHVGLFFAHTDAVGGGIGYTIHTTTASAASQASTPAAVSGVTLYAAQADVEYVWSEFGVLGRVDDDQNGVADDDLVELALQKASIDVNVCLLARYTVAAVSASTWARWATAHIAALSIGIRRGNPMPADLYQEVQAYRDELKAIKLGSAHLMGDTGPATPRYNVAPAHSNLEVDGRYRRAKIRRIEQTSTGGSTTSPKRHDTADPIQFFP